MLARSESAGERDIVALRVMPRLPNGDRVAVAQRRDAGWLIDRGARVGAIALATGAMASDSTETRVRLAQVDALAARCGAMHGQRDGDGAVDPEADLLRRFIDHLGRLSNPLLITCGGRALDLPFLRYRCFAKGVALPILHLRLANRLNYFDRFDQGWHVDVSDVLSGHGASQPLPLAALSTLGGIGRPQTTDLCAQARGEALMVFAVFLRMLQVMGHLPAAEYRRAMDTVEIEGAFMAGAASSP